MSDNILSKAKKSTERGGGQDFTQRPEIKQRQLFPETNQGGFVVKLYQNNQDFFCL